MRCFLRQITDGSMDLVDGALSGLHELALRIAPLIAAQQPVRDHVEVAPDRADRPDGFAQLGEFILREGDGTLDLLPDQCDNPTLGGLSGRFRELTHALHLMLAQAEPKLAAIATSTG